MPKKLPTAAAAWAAINALKAHDEGDPDVKRSDYAGPIPAAVIAAAMLDLHARLASLEARSRP